MNENDRDVESAPQDSEVDPEVMMAKHRAYQRARSRVNKKAVLVSWLLALPAAWLAWETQSYQFILNSLEGTPSEIERVRTFFELSTVFIAWGTAVFFLAPLRWHLKSRWRVDPARYGMSSGGESSD